MKKIYILTLLFVLYNFVSAQTATAPAGAGTLASPYLISSLNNLYWLSQNSAQWASGKYFLQTANIDATSTSSWNSSQGWTPIGNNTTNFGGNYDGGNYTILNLYVNTTSNTTGLFGKTNSSAVIKNIGVTSAGISAAYNVGSLVGDNAGLIDLCSATGNVTGNATGSSGIGGLVGNNTGTITRSYTKNGTISASIGSPFGIGGLVGINTGTGTIERCYSKSNATSSGQQAGGLVGRNGYNSGGTIRNSYATGNVSGTVYCGGFVGFPVSGIIENSYSTGNVSISDPAGYAQAAGFSGGSASCTITNCFWDTQSSGKTTSSGGTGRTTAQMKTLSTFTSATWDFQNETTNGTNDFWGLSCADNNGYPYLSWEGFTNTPCSPTIATSGTLSSFSSCQGTASTNQTLSVSGTNLTANISISAPSGFEISTNASSGFNSSLTLTQSGGSIASTTIYIRLTAVATGTPSGNISFTSTGATTVDRAVSGNVSNPTITGTLDVYEDNTTQLSCTDAAAASTPWLSLNTSLVTTNSTGLVTGMYPGTGRIVYTTNAGCKDTVSIVVHATEWNGNNNNDFATGANWKLNAKPSVIKKIRFNNNAANNLILGTRTVVDSIDFGNSNKQIEIGNHDLIVNDVKNFNANKFIKTNGTGKVKKQLANNTSFTFPVGKSSYNPITITNKTGTADSFSVNIIDTAYLNGTTSGNINNPYVKRTWNISKNTPSANSSNGVDLSFTWNANEVVGTLTTPTLNHHNGIGWEIPTIGTSSVSGNTLTYTGYKGTFSPFAIGGSSTVALPVELKEFKTSCQSDYIQIDWTTASEIRNKAFELYKSENAQDWNFIHTEAGQGDKATETKYSFKDLDKKQGYYRLKDIDEDGIENWSQIIFADCKNEISGIQIYPNPASDFIKVIAPISEHTTLNIISLEGKVLKTMPLISNQTLLSVKDLASGVYMIEIKNQKQIEQIKFLKK